MAHDGATREAGTPVGDAKTLDKIGLLEEMKVALIEEADLGQSLCAKEEAWPCNDSGFVEVAPTSTPTTDNLVFVAKEIPGPRVGCAEGDSFLIMIIRSASSGREDAKPCVSFHASHELVKRCR